ncbi:putative spermidine/putrescine transport system ATP-binding protein [Stella humosa]|uniref:Spermidine/putrescine import ATP-binding protein PotA n=1 Tax=Stella humosa TaxID=94 RepID=A0A3N1KUL4_9PROT|nr:ABC transporter ATP-binding protein [Stella humosa]ROP84271.1 putative spermidine/putrescine transport system ATP-binding protein [Stella humosa]BBK33784.1 polyamine-transporting ATPase [Stella humosa]
MSADAGRVRPPILVVDGARKTYGGVVALERVSLTVHEGEFVTLLGPSGSGKTTLLKAIAGFEEIDEGRIALGGQDITDMPPAGRGIGMVFQNYALFPHLTVARNIAFPLEMRGVARREIDRRVAEILELVELGGYGGRLPRQLSGGQQQRVALARATVFNPRLLLLDEPFSALDRKLRESMQVELRHLQQRLGLTTVFVTHDQEEALLLSDRIAVMSNGRIEQLDRPTAIYERPASRFVAGFVGEANLLRGTPDGERDGRPTVMLESGERLVAGDLARLDAPLQLVVRPERIRWVARAEEADNAFSATIVEHLYLGQDSKYRVRLQSGLELVLRTQGTGTDHHPAAGESRMVGWDAADVRGVPCN